MTNKPRELRQERAKLIHDARSLLEKAETEQRDLSSEESAQYDKMFEDSGKLLQRAERIERQDQAEAELAASTIETRETPEGNKETANSRAFEKWLTGGSNVLDSTERRALQVDVDTTGGYIVPPLQWVNELIQAVDNQVFMRQLATIYQVPQAQSLGAPSLDNDPADPTWVSELSIGTEDSTMSFGKRELNPHPLAQFIKVSNTLLRKATIGPEALVRDRLAYKTAVVQENAFLNGSGSGQPLGVFTATSLGISTDRDVSTDNTTALIKTDNLYNVKYTLKAQYWPNARWIFHRDAVKQIAKLKDGEGRYMWQNGIVDGEPDRILSFPVVTSEYAPSTFTTLLYVGILGDFRYYWIADALNMQIQRLNELYAATNQVGFIARSETDGMPVLEEAFVRVKLG